jgi:hypothetical protein
LRLTAPRRRGDRAGRSTREPAPCKHGRRLCHRARTSESPTRGSLTLERDEPIPVPAKAHRRRAARTSVPLARARMPFAARDPSGSIRPGLAALGGLTPAGARASFRREAARS